MKILRLFVSLVSVPQDHESLGHRTLEFDESADDRVGKAEIRCVQADSAKYLRVGSVAPVAHQRTPHLCQVHPDLVLSTGFGLNFEQGVSVEPFHHPIMRYGQFCAGRFVGRSHFSVDTFP